MELDSIDRSLLAELQRDGRASFETLARRVQLSRTAARARTLRILSTDSVRVVGIVHPGVFGLSVFAHLSVLVDGPARPVAERIAALSQAPFVSLVAGAHSVIAEVRVRDFPALTEVVTSIRGTPDVRAIRTATYTSVVKDPYFPPGMLYPITLDETDRALLAELQRDGRMPYTDLAHVAALSVAPTRARVRRMIQAGVVHIGALVQPVALGLGQMCGVALTLDDEEDALAAVAELPAVHLLASCVGHCDAIGTLQAASPADLLAALEQVRGMPGVCSVEGWAHLDLIKEEYGPSPLEEIPLAGEEAL